MRAGLFKEICGFNQTFIVCFKSKKIRLNVDIVEIFLRQTFPTKGRDKKIFDTSISDDEN